MSFCPECKYEYRAGITECPDCQVGLVEKVPEEPAVDSSVKCPPSDEPVTVFSTWDDMAAIATAKCILEGAGIWCYAKNETVRGFMRTTGLGYDALAGPVEIQVAPRDVEAASELLKELTEAPELEEETEQ